ncbi:MAG: hypothetical protein WC792_02170 [Candidatus Micrarchaeia archaeon]
MQEKKGEKAEKSADGEKRKIPRFFPQKPLSSLFWFLCLQSLFVDFEPGRHESIRTQQREAKFANIRESRHLLSAELWAQAGWEGLKPAIRTKEFGPARPSLGQCKWG